MDWNTDHFLTRFSIWKRRETSDTTALDSWQGAIPAYRSALPIEAQPKTPDVSMAALWCLQIKSKLNKAWGCSKWSMGVRNESIQNVTSDYKPATARAVFLVESYLTFFVGYILDLMRLGSLPMHLNVKQIDLLLMSNSNLAMPGGKWSESTLELEFAFAHEDAPAHDMAAVRSGWTAHNRSPKGYLSGSTRGCGCFGQPSVSTSGNRWYKLGSTVRWSE